MTTSERLTEFQKGQFCSAIALGSDRSTACAFAGATTAQLRATFRYDPAFERDVQRSEAQAEIRHLGNIHRASEDQKNWRTSVWWLERHAPERFGPRAATALTADQVAALVEQFVEALAIEVQDDALRRRLSRLLLAAAAAANAPASRDPEAPLLGASSVDATEGGEP